MTVCNYTQVYMQSPTLAMQLSTLVAKGVCIHTQLEMQFSTFINAILHNWFVKTLFLIPKARFYKKLETTQFNYLN